MLKGCQGQQLEAGTVARSKCLSVRLWFEQIQCSFNEVQSSLSTVWRMFLLMMMLVLCLSLTQVRLSGASPQFHLLPGSTWATLGILPFSWVFAGMMILAGFINCFNWSILVSIVHVTAAAQHNKICATTSWLENPNPENPEKSRGFLVKQCTGHWVGNCSIYIFRLFGIVCERAGSSHRVPSALLSSAEWTNPQNGEFGSPTLTVTPPRNPTFSLSVGPSSVSFALTFPFTPLWASLFFGASQSHIKN